MSACISGFGEYGSHEPSETDPYTCGLCGVEDTDRMRQDLAVLRTDSAVERVAEAIAQAEDERHWLWLGSGIKDSYRRMARAVIDALLDGEA